MKPTSAMHVPEPDGLIYEAVGGWAEDKYWLISSYDSLFSTGMKDKWDMRVYIDLYAGSGVSQVRGTDRLLAGSPLLALTVSYPFDRYIFCEADEDKIAALRQRAERLKPDADVRYIPGDCNKNVDDILNALPPSNVNALSLCFVDPYDIGLYFSTLKLIAKQRPTDFLVLLAMHMDANRAKEIYTTKNPEKVNNLLGSTTWLQDWQASRTKVTQGEPKIDFPHFLADQFSMRMHSIGYLRTPVHEMKLVKSDDNVPLYYLAFFSKHHRGHDFWNKARKSSTHQRDLF
jgi:three-Cys-motif partner protein